MRRIACGFVVAVLLSVGWLACGGSSMPTTPTPTSTTPTVTAVAVTGAAASAGATAQFTATASLSNSTTQNVTSQATWASSSTAVATVSSAGLVSSVAAGDADIRATFQSVAGTLHITVTAPPVTPNVTSVTVTGSAPSSIGGTSQLTATASLSNGSTQNITSQASWQSSDTRVVTVSSSGIVTGIGAGQADVSATYQTVTGSLHLTVAAPTPTPTVTGVSVSGNAPNVGASAQFTATASLSNGTSQNVTSQASWESSASSIATVSGSGVVIGVSAGDADITASYQNLTGRLRITVGRPQVAAPRLPTRTAKGSSFTCQLDDIVHPASGVSDMFGNATALCIDGDRSCSTSNSGTCSSH